MANIRVYPSKLNSAATNIDNKVAIIKRKMSSSNNQVALLSSAWSGKDYDKFKARWEGIDENGSVYSKTIKSLESYSNYLKYAESKYKRAQSDAINRANRLPRW